MEQQVHQHLLDIAAPSFPKLEQVLLRFGPMALPSRADQPFEEVLSRSVAGQQLSVKAAASIWNRVINSCGSSPLMPFIEQAAIEELRGCGLSNAKCKTLKGIADAHQQGLLSQQALANMAPSDRHEHLIQLWGIGQWTADMMNIFYFAETDIWPDADVTARKTLLSLTEADGNSVEIANQFAPYRSYLALYMYTLVDAPPTTLEQ